MPRPPRISIPDTTFHVVQRGNNQARTFFADQDYALYLALLEYACRRYQTQVHAYVLMTNHVHLLVTSSLPEGVSRTMQYVGSRYVAKVNLRLGRTGTLWEGRFRSSPVDTDRYLLACYRYIEQNPVRAGMVRRPDDYTWSSVRINCGTRSSSLVKPHPVFLALGSTARVRAARYRQLLDEGLAQQTVDEIRNSVRSGLPAGSDEFRQSLEASLNRPLCRRRPGRPRKEQKAASRTSDLWE
ncbi:MAG TPA: transposase [Gammaproteobacteria bacterium]